MEDEKVLQKEIQTIDQQVNIIIIKDINTFNSAGRMTINLDVLIKRINAYWEDSIKKAYDTHKSLTAKRAQMLKPVEDHRKILKSRISAYLTEQDRIRKEEQAKLDAERKIQEETERKRIEERAAKAEEKGKLEKAEKLREKAAEVYVPPVVIQAKVEKTTRLNTGTITQIKDIELTIIDPLEIIKTIANGQGPISILEIKEAKLKSFIKDQGLKEFPGCIVEEIMKGNFKAK